MTTHGTTLKEIRAEALPKAEQMFRASDFLSDKEKQELHASNARGKEEPKPYDKVDAFEAEMIARFGFDFYKAWLNGELDEGFAFRLIAAEREREKQLMAPIMSMVLMANAGANNGDKNGNAPKSLRIAQDILKKILK